MPVAVRAAAGSAAAPAAGHLLTLAGSFAPARRFCGLSHKKPLLQQIAFLPSV